MRPIKKKSHRRNRRQMILWRRFGSLMLAVCLIGVVLLSDHLTGVLAREDFTDIESIETAETDAEAEIGVGEAETVEQTEMVDCQPVELQEESVFTDEMPFVDMEDTETDSNDAADAEVNVEEDSEITSEDEESAEVEEEDWSSGEETELFDAGQSTEDADFQSGDTEISKLIDADIALLKWKAGEKSAVTITVGDSEYNVSDTDSYENAYAVVYKAMEQAATNLSPKEAGLDTEAAMVESENPPLTTIETQKITTDTIWNISGNVPMTGTVTIETSGRLVIMGNGTIVRSSCSEDSSIKLVGKLCLQGSVVFKGGKENCDARFLKANGGNTGGIAELYLTDSFKIQEITVNDKNGAGIYGGNANVYMSGGMIGSDELTFTWDNDITTKYGVETENYLTQQEQQNEYRYLKSINSENGCIAKGTKVDSVPNGAGIYMYSSTFYMSGGNIVGNKLFGICTEQKDAKGESHDGKGSHGAGAYFSSCQVNITGGKISGNQSTTTSEANKRYKQYAGAIQLDGTGTCNLSNVEVAYNYAQMWVGAIDAYPGSTLNVNGGAVIKYNCAMSNCGGIAVDGTNVKMNMNGGKIIHNYSGGLGGGIRCLGTFVMNGGEISYNKSKGNAAGLSVQSDETRKGKAILNGGSIHHNNSVSNGGGMGIVTGYQGENSGLTLNGTEVYSNTALNGGGFYIDAKDGTVNVELASGNIYENCAGNGGGVYINQENECIATLLMTSNKMIIEKNFASQNGGGIYLNHNIKSTGSIAAEIQKGYVRDNTAGTDGGGAYLESGLFTIENGIFEANTATNGGGAYVSDGKVRMFGGNITNNTAIQNGGGFYVSSNQQAADVVIRSGNITGNSAGISENTSTLGNGGAIAVVSSASEKKDQVVIGLLETHKDLNLSDHKFTAFDYTDSLDNKSHNHSSCPELKNNKASGNGGAIYMSSSQATLNIYCLEEENNTSTLNSNGNSVMAEGGTVVIGDSENNNQSARGNIVIGSSMLVSGGNVDVYGNMDNPYFKNDILVDIKSNAGEFDDHRISASETTKEYKVHYYENFVTDSGIFKAKQYGEDVNVSAEGALFVHEGFKIIGWDTQANGKGTRYAIGAAIGSKNDHSAWESRGDTTTEDDPLVLYAIWEEISYTVKFDCNTTGQHSGNMKDQKFTYGKEQILTANTYKVIGKRFNGWNTSADGTGTSYTADYKESKMSSTDGATVTLYAQWVDCTHNGGEHPGTLTYAIADNKAQKTATITENCDCGGHTASLTLSAVDAYHDGSAHPATLNYTGKWLTAKPTITYQYKSGSASEYGAMPGNESEPMSTGFYKATIKVNDNTTVSVEYQIKSPAANTTVEVEAAEGEYFTDFNGQNTISEIPADDAFTVQYTIQKLNTKYYTTAPFLQLNSQLPKGTTVIMQTGGTYWYYNVASDTVQLALTEFSKMGSTDKFTYDTANIASNQTYRFIFDLSGVSSWSLPANGMDISLIYNSIVGQNGSQNENVSGKATIKFRESVQFGLTINGSNVTVTAPDNNGYSRWSGRSMLLKVGSAPNAANKLPTDAKLTVTSAGSTGTYTLNQNGQFIVPFSWSANKTFSLALSSDTISSRGKSYSLTVSLAVAPNTASSDLVSAMEYDTGKTADFSVQIAESTAPSLKITGSQRLVSTTTAELDVTVNMKNTGNCIVQATIQMKTGENYSGTYLSGASVNSGENKFSLGGITKAGSYRLLIQVIKDSQNILEVPYYFNVQ